MLVLLTFILTILSPFTVLALENQGSLAINTALEYMNARRSMLNSGNSDSLSMIAVTGIVTDEIKHREYLLEQNLSLPDVTYSVDSVNTWDDYAVVYISEIPTDNASQNTSNETTHILTIFFEEDGNALVISDNYYEIFSGFESCSYVVEYTDNHTRAMGASTSKNCLLYLANKEVGYLEKASNSQLDSKTANAGTANYTKYGAWYGSNAVPWCAIFVSWCADQANIPTTKIPKASYVPTMAYFFQDQGLYYESASAGGNYTPKKGDLFFTTSYDHIGIVYIVTSSYITVIDGNYGDQVSKRNISLTDSSLIGYASPDIAQTEHIWTGEPMFEYCRNCGASKNYAV